MAMKTTSVDCAVGTLAANVYALGGGPFGVILYFHGGGWVIADKDDYDGGARGLAHAAAAIEAGVDEGDTRHAAEIGIDERGRESLRFSSLRTR